jgi:hypothetical protein
MTPEGDAGYADDIDSDAERGAELGLGNDDDSSDDDMFRPKSLPPSPAYQPSPPPEWEDQEQEVEHEPDVDQPEAEKIDVDPAARRGKEEGEVSDIARPDPSALPK